MLSKGVAEIIADYAVASVLADSYRKALEEILGESDPDAMKAIALEALRRKKR